MLIYIVRHGETKANEEGYLQGWSNDPLNENGRRLSVITGQGLKAIRFDHCISSPLLRAKETAEIILRESGNHIPIELDERIKEINLGEWERKKFRAGESTIDRKAVKMFLTNPLEMTACHGGETVQEVCKRTQAFLKELLQRNDNKTYLVTTHGVALRSMLNFLYENKEDFWHGHVPYNCAVNIVEGKNGDGRLIADDRVYYALADVVDRYAKF